MLQLPPANASDIQKKLFTNMASALVRETWQGLRERQVPHLPVPLFLRHGIQVWVRPAGVLVVCSRPGLDSDLLVDPTKEVHEGGEGVQTLHGQGDSRETSPTDTKEVMSREEPGQYKVVLCGALIATKHSNSRSLTRGW